jgi:hypothetical protein
MESLFEMFEVEMPSEATIEEKAMAFHIANPRVYQELRRLALTLFYRGHKHFGAKLLTEQLRWLWMERTSDMSGYKINNNFVATYSRLLMSQEPELRGVFSTRTTRGELVLTMEGLDD